MFAPPATPDSRPPIPDPRPPEQGDRRFLLRRAAIAPICLCLVAGLHAVRVATCGQTQWKGGGFGMFSTVDSEASRFVRAFAETPQGKLPLAIPSHLDKTVAELRAAPTQAQLDALATRLAAMHWRRPDEHLFREAQRLTGKSSAPPQLSPPPIGLDRSLEAIPNGKSTEYAIGVSTIRVECWRLRLDAATSSLRGEQLREATANAAAEATP